jgi:hypothetical protein
MLEGQAQKVASELRREARQSPARSYAGEVRLRDRRTQVEFPAVAVHNYSSSGASVLASLEYQPGRQISLIVFSEGIRMEFFGTVAGCRAANDADHGEGRPPTGTLMYLVGLQMQGPVGLAAVLNARPTTRDG